MTDTDILISSTVVTDEDARMNFLPKYFGKDLFFTGEAFTYTWLSCISKDYKGGMWDFLELSNNGFYLRPQATNKFHLDVAGNHFSGVLSPDAAGIVATLFSVSHLINKGHERLIDSYYALLDFASQHEESDLIMGAID